MSLATSRKRPATVVSSDCEEETVPTASDQAAAPPRAKISRSRSVPCNSGKQHNERAVRNAATSTKVVKESLWDRVKEFPGKGLALCNGKLRCSFCCEILSSKKIIVAEHCKSKKHAKSKAETAESKKRTQTIQNAFRKQDIEAHTVGETLPIDMRVWRMMVLQGFLSAGVPIRKIDQLRPLLETNNHRLTEHSHLLNLIPVLLKEELRLIREELKQPDLPEDKYLSRDLSLIFDGSTRLGEAIAIIVRFLDKDWTIIRDWYDWMWWLVLAPSGTSDPGLSRRFHY